jgi:cytochrome oxidase assembly protein ShyY1
MKKNKFNPGVRISIFFVFFAIVFFSLGLWQIERGQSKTDLLKEFKNNTLQEPNYLTEASKKWDRVFVEGKWDSSQQILIDNVINRGVAELISDAWPKVSQTKNLEIITKEYNEEIYPLILLADPTSKNSLEYIKINPTNMTPVKHYGYSAQWFLMFIVLCVMYVWFGFKKNEK